MDSITFLGLSAGLLTTVSAVPQLLKAWRTKSTADISLGAVVLLVSGVGLWLLYGIMINNFPLIAANVVTLIVWIGTLILKLRFDGTNAV
ncbi:MAG TPA: hypothetical protein HA254_00365 [Candidatus Diapherotrites archaeon]|uniref:SemiSWEET transporter n=1 Tax=Candidatus Iainarchaeum sp. TaxID=3101447 RepID=A0A7J4IUC1_9ARCH|nr:hypothetical protein [Candidatus Diapherotrites archaeon]